MKVKGGLAVTCQESLGGRMGLYYSKARVIVKGKGGAYGSADGCDV
jgi:hypothetical protein